MTLDDKLQIAVTALDRIATAAKAEPKDRAPRSVIGDIESFARAALRAIGIEEMPPA